MFYQVWNSYQESFRRRNKKLKTIGKWIKSTDDTFFNNFLFVSHNLLNINLLHINSDTLYISNTVKHERLLQIRQKPVYSSFCKFFANFTEICILVEKYCVTGQIKVVFIFSVRRLSLIIMFYPSKNLETNVKLFYGFLQTFLSQCNCKPGNFYRISSFLCHWEL